MADENILTRLGKLFQNQIVVRKTDDGQVKVKDVEFSQTALTSNFIDVFVIFERLVKNPLIGPGLSQFTADWEKTGQSTR